MPLIASTTYRCRVLGVLGSMRIGRQPCAGLVAFVCAALIAACTRLPTVKDATNNFPFTQSIPIDDIVQRVKCDISEALYEKLYVGRDKDKLQWLQGWTAKADLTLEANQSGGITPNIAYVQPLTSAFFSGAGPNTVNTVTGAVTNVASATAQNFTFGIGGTFSGQAIRTETMSFTISLAELKDWRETSPDAKFCTPKGVSDLQAGLDLKSWLDEALMPVVLGHLETGIHPSPGATSSKAPAPSTKPKASASILFLQEKKVRPPVKNPFESPEQKAYYDLQLATALTALGVRYDLNQFNSPPQNAKDPAYSTFCALKKGEGDEPSVLLKPPTFPSVAPDNLEKLATVAAQNAFSSMYQAVASPVLSDHIKERAEKAAALAGSQAVKVKTALPYAIEHITDICKVESDLYLKTGAPCMTGTAENKTYVVVQLSPQFCDRVEYKKYLKEFFNDQFLRAQTLTALAQKNAALAQNLTTPDPPIESIGQSMNFVVTVGASISPNWTYLHWKAPANSASLAGVSGIRTHTLNIAMGSVTAPTELQRVLSNAATRQAIQGLVQ